MINIQSRQRKPETEVLQITSWLSWLPENNTVAFDPKEKVTLFAEVIRGRSPVLHADVTAIVERPQSGALRIPLHDNGMGVYSVPPPPNPQTTPVLIASLA